MLIKKFLSRYKIAVLSCSLIVLFGFAFYAAGQAGTTSIGHNIDVAGTIAIRGGSPAAGRVLTSDAQGNAEWSVISPEAGSRWTLSGNNLYPDETTWNVGIGTTSPGVYKLNVAGTVRATEYFHGSDAAIKENVLPLESSLEKVLSLRGVSFSWKDGARKSMGLVAQEVEDVFPEIVLGEEGEKSIQYTALIAPLIEGMREQQAEIEGLREEVERLKKAIE